MKKFTQEELEKLAIEMLEQLGLEAGVCSVDFQIAMFYLEKVNDQMP